MPSLPIPLFTALVLGFLFLRNWLTEGRVTALAGLLGLCALQALIISLAQHYREPSMLTVQPLTATLIAPAAWMAFQTTTQRDPDGRDLIHLAGPLLAIVAIAVAPILIDLLIPALFVGYGTAILLRSLKGADALPRLRLSGGEVPARLWQIIGIALAASALSDVLIIWLQIAGLSHLQPWVISGYSVANLLIIGAVSLSEPLSSNPEPAEAPPAPEPEIDPDLMPRLEALMSSERLYLDPDLTLTRLARRLGVPAKKLSIAINHTTGENVSRYINTARIRAAQQALTEGENVTTAMLSSGFNTKSNFNREFLRVTGESPTAWVKART